MKKVLIYTFLVALFYSVNRYTLASTTSLDLNVTGYVYPDESGAAILDENNCLLIINSTELAVNVTIDNSCTHPGISFESLVTDGSAPTPHINIVAENMGGVAIAIPSTIISSSSADWDGYMQLPTDTSVTLPTYSDKVLTQETAINLGSVNSKLYFDNALRLLIPDDKNKLAGFSDVDSTFSTITDNCGSDSGSGLDVNSECRYTNSNDLIIWTNHLSKYFTYTSKKINNTDNSSNNSNSSSSSDSSSDDSNSSTTEETISTPQAVQQDETGDNSSELMLFDIALTLEESLLKRAEDLIAYVELTNFGNVPTEVDLRYSVRKENGEVLYSTSNKITVETESLVSQTFKDLKLDDGNYNLILETNYGENVYDEFRQSFSINTPKSFPTKLVLNLSIIPLLVFVILIILKKKKANS